jgi:hypothetical protein
MNGVLLATGPIIRQNVWIEGARLMDMAPTILYALGEPVPGHMDGIVLEDLFLPAYLEAHPVQHSAQSNVSTIGSVDSGYSPEEEEQIKKQLERLGYL